ncbi:MAG: O-antigen ligase family protein [Eubacteriales bacterium]
MKQKEKTSREPAGASGEKTYTLWTKLGTAMHDGFRNLCKSSLIGSYLTSYDRFESAAQHSYLGTAPGQTVKRQRKKRYSPKKEVGTEKIDRHLSIYNAATLRQPTSKHFRRVLSRNRLIGGLIGFLKDLPYAPVSALGTLMFSLGVSTALMQILRIFMGAEIAPLVGVMLSGFALLIASAPLISKNGVSIRHYILTSRFGNGVLVPFLGLTEKDLEGKDRQAQPIRMCLVAGFVGIICGLFTLYFSFLTVAFALFFSVIILMSVFVPEFGIMVILFALPFVNLLSGGNILMGIFVVTVLLCYLFNVMIGKRVVHFETFDFVLLIPAIYMIASELLIGGDYAPGGTICLILLGMILYFLGKNLLSARKWIECSMGSLIASSTVVSAVGIVQALLNRTVGVSSVFADATGLAVYLLMTAFLSISALKQRFFGAFPLLVSMAMQLICLVLTGSKTAIVAFLLSCLLYLGLSGKKMFSILLLTVICAPLTLPFLPERITDWLCSILLLRDSSILNRVTVWTGAFRIGRDTLFCGIGLSDETFSSYYSVYAAGSSVPDAPNASGLYLGLLIGAGFLGLILFLAAMLLLMRMCFSFYSGQGMKYDLTSVHLAVFCGIFAVLLCGLTMSVWSTGVNFMMFWLLVGYCVAVRRYVVDEHTVYRRDLSDIQGEIVLKF